MPEIDSELELALNYLDHNKDESLKRLFDILKIPSISTQEKYSKDCLNAANWFVEQLKDIGFDASIRETNGHPMVVAHFEQEGLIFFFMVIMMFNLLILLSFGTMILSNQKLKNHIMVK